MSEKSKKVTLFDSPTLKVIKRRSSGTRRPAAFIIQTADRGGRPTGKLVISKDDLTELIAVLVDAQTGVNYEQD